ITRPNLFGPEPQEVCDTVFKSLPYRLMAHTAEDLCEYFMPNDELVRCSHGDVRHGFIMSFPGHAPEFDLMELESKVLDMIAQELPVGYVDESHMSIGGQIHVCTGPRTHVSNTGKIKGFKLLNHFIYDSMKKCYLMVGSVGEKSEENLQKLDRMIR
ncbi:MAG: alanine-tRNA synthetase second additional domain-containing protein, partial [Clostridia bacterium]|nr:alanine-tRNA synthetase second additional domain-containing protein [Clostridia bacterium]